MLSSGGRESLNLWLGSCGPSACIDYANQIFRHHKLYFCLNGREWEKKKNLKKNQNQLNKIPNNLGPGMAKPKIEEGRSQMEDLIQKEQKA